MGEYSVIGHTLEVCKHHWLCAVVNGENIQWWTRALWMLYVIYVNFVNITDYVVAAVIKVAEHSFAGGQR